VPHHQLDDPTRSRRTQALRISPVLLLQESDDIRQLFTDALDLVGVEWTTLARGSDPFNISIARKASVALMDTHVGPKH
jgi:hypothetical protein